VSSRDEREARTHFRERYAIPTAAVSAAIEQRVIGAVWGANGYTTVIQADELGRRLGLGPGWTLLDVGTGRGWPGLYLAAQSGCSLIGTDMPLDALSVAASRAREEGIDERVALVAAGAAHQPFRPECFDAIVHTDVLC
jgi:2-polyprenyl-3-methyl-5-hydroxy-6-metoxy-1,4-benzoquinol methylase